MKTQHSKTLSRLTVAACIGSIFALTFGGDRSLPQSTLAAPIVAQVGSIGFTPPPPPPGRDAPGSRGGGAGRGCGAGKQSLTALVPQYQQTLDRGAITKVWGTTTAERPTFWFDVPYETGAIAALEFVLQDNATPPNDVYQTEIVPPDAPGIVSVQLPATVPTLEAGKLYQWFFTVRLRCGSSASIVKSQSKEEIYGWVQRVSPSASLTSQLKQATPQQRAILYAQTGIWFDALTTLAELRLANPQNAQLVKDWNGLLQAVGLEKLTANPLIPCCKSKP